MTRNQIYFAGDNIVASIENHARERPEFLIEVFVDQKGNRTHLTWGEMLSRIHTMAKGIAQAGIEPGDILILALDHSIELETLFLGGIFSRAIPNIYGYLAFNMDSDFYAQEILGLARAVGTRAVISSTKLKPALENRHQIAVYTPGEIQSLAENYSGIWQIPRDIQAGDTAFLQFSSGTTGQKKGIGIRHNAIKNHLLSIKDSIQFIPEDIWINWLPLNHDMGLFSNLLIPKGLNFTSISVSPFYWLRRPKIVYELIHDYRASGISMPNFAFNYDTRVVREKDLEGLDLSSMCYMINGSEPIRPETIQNYIDKFSKYGLDKEVIKPAYGMAENAVSISLTDRGEPLAVDWVDKDILERDHKAVPGLPHSQQTVPLISSGKIVSGTQLRFVGENGELLPDRHIGEAEIAGNSIFTGYWGQPEMAGEHFRDGWFKTGDLGYLADGQVYITGRKKELMIVGGKNIYPQDIDRLVNEFEGIRPGQVATFGVSIDESASEGMVVVAELKRPVPKDLSELERAIRKRVRQVTGLALHDLKLINGRFVEKTSSGKIARNATRQKYLETI